MSARDLAFEGIETAINAILVLDPETCDRLAAMHGRVIRVVLSGTGIQFDFIPGHDGRVNLLAGAEGDPDATLHGKPIDLLRASDEAEGHAELFAGRVQIEGDVSLAQHFSEALAGLDIDWEEQLSRLVGDIAAHEIGEAARAIRRHADRTGQSARSNLSEYLTEEARLLPHRFEAEAFLADVDTLRDDAARLEARIALLEQARGGDDGR